VRRVFPILLALVLVPFTATASWYRCAYDGVTRSTCCCPTDKSESKQSPTQTNAAWKEACCCTVTHAMTAAPADRASQSASIDMSPMSITTALAIPDPLFCAIDPPARSRAPDPPDTLFSRRCSLLL